MLCDIANISSCNENPDYSPNGKQIVYDRNYAPAGGGGTYDKSGIANADGSDAHQLTNTKDRPNDANPAWSPNGKSIAFERNAGDPPPTPMARRYTRSTSTATGLRQLTPDNPKLTVCPSGPRTAQQSLLTKTSLPARSAQQVTTPFVRTAPA